MILINRNFNLLWIGQLVSQLGDRFYQIALAWWILDRTNSPLAMGLFLFASVMPGLFLGPLAGIYIDRWNRKAILIIADIFRFLTVLLVVWLSWGGNLELWHVFAAGVVISLVSMFFDPTVITIIPQVVSEEQLGQANAFNQLVTGITTVIGPIIGASFVGFMGFTTVFLLNALSYLVSAGFETFLRLPGPDNRATLNNPWENFHEGLRFIIGKPRISLVLIIVGVTHLFFGTLPVLLPVLAKQVGSGSITTLGYLETTLGVGLILGSIVAGQIKTRDQNLDLLGYIVIAMGFSGISLGLIRLLNFGSIWPYIMVLLITGGLVANASVTWRSVLQLSTPNEMSGRVFSIMTTISDISLPMAYGLTGLILNYTKICFVSLGSGIGMVAMGLILSRTVARQGHKIPVEGTVE